jgi:glycosyltransferase involved in cell wall biosynthesis
MKTLGIIMAQEPSSGGGFQYESTLLNTLFDLAHQTQLFKLVILTDNPASLWNHCDDQSFMSFKNAKVISAAPPSSPPQNFLTPTARAKCKLFKIPVDVNLNSYLRRMEIHSLFCLSPTYKGIQSGLPFSMPIWDLTHKHQFPVHYPEVFDNETPSYRDLLYANACLAAHTIIAESEAGKDDVLSHYGSIINSDKVKIIDFIPKQLIPRTVQHAFPSQAISRVIGRRFFYYPAQFWRHKHHDTLIKAVKILDLQLPSDITLVFSGSVGDYDRAQWYPELLKLTEELDIQHRVFFAGYLPEQDVDYLYGHALAMLMPSAFGPSNLPPLEAIAMSCPIAVGDAYGMQRFLPYGVPILPCNDSQRWAEIMIRLATDSAYRLELIESQRANLQGKSYAQLKGQLLNALPF